MFAPTNRAWYQALVSLGATKEDVFEVRLHFYYFFFLATTAGCQVERPFF